MAVWQEKRLGDIFSLKYGKSSDKMIPGSEYKVFSSSGLFGLSNSKLADKGIIVGRKGSVGSVFFSRNPFYCIDTTFYIDNTNNENMLFIYYYLKNMKLNLYNSDAAVPGLNKHHLERCYCIIPDLVTQEKIADILSTYDDLIENNNRRIEILEQMAQEIYKEWFVRFRFPGHEKVKFVNGIPEGWEVKKIKDFGNIITGKTPSTEVYENYGKDIMFIKTPDMHDTVFTTYSSEYLSEKGHLTQANKLIPANSILVSCIGTAGIVSINAEAAHTNQQINSIVLNDENLLYWLFFSCRFLKNTIELYGATGATMTNLSKGKFENLKILMPKQELVYLYNNKVNNIFSHIKTLLYFNQNLIKQRDLLLPRLMSGKLEV